MTADLTPSEREADRNAAEFRAERGELREALIEKLRPLVPNHGSVIWEFEHEDGQREPITLRTVADALIAGPLAGLLAELERLRISAHNWEFTARDGAKVLDRVNGSWGDALAELDRLRAREAAIVKRLWAAFGCAPNPDAFKESVRDVLVGEMERFARESENRSSRVDRDNRRLRAQVEAVRDQLAEVAELAEDRGITVGQVRDLLDGWEADYRQYLSIVENGKPNRWITDLRRILDAADGGDETCGCWTCMSERPGPLGMPMTASVMVTCPTCGNKRCPRSTHHDNACTGSNEPGQTGSRFRAADGGDRDE